VSTFVRGSAATQAEPFPFIPHFRSLQDNPNITVVKMTVVEKTSEAAMLVADIKNIWVTTDESARRVESLDLKKCTMFGKIF